MKLWRKLVKVHADLQTLSYTMHSYNFVSRSVEFLIEALQEQVTIVKNRNRKFKKECQQLIYAFESKVLTNMLL